MRAIVNKSYTSQGFSLVDVLVYSSILSVLFLLSSNLITTILRNTGKIEARQLAIEDWTRVRFLIDTEVSESSEVSYNEKTPCGGTSLFTLKRMDSPDGKKTHYTVFRTKDNTHQLWRCGLPFRGNGSLNQGGQVSLALVTKDVDISIKDRSPLGFLLTYNYGKGGITAFTSPKESTFTVRTQDIK